MESSLSSFRCFAIFTYWKNIVHKDIKPWNLFLDKEKNIKIGDFGSSGIMPILTKITTSLMLTNKSYTPVCKALEDDITFKSDIWSLGVTLYYMSQIVYPFGDESEKVIKDNKLNKVPNDIDNNFSKELNNLIKQMLEKDHLKRPSAKECMRLRPREVKERLKGKYNIHINKNFDDFLIRIFFSFLAQLD